MKKNNGFGTLIAIVIGIIIAFAVTYPKYKETKLSANDQILNEYASFASSCFNRGYSEDECLLIWSGR